MRIDVLLQYDVRFLGREGGRQKIGSSSYLDHFMSITCITTIYHLHISLTMHYRLSVYLI
jgi:hypothetical protein